MGLLPWLLALPTRAQPPSGAGPSGGAPAAQPFEGIWDTILSCPNTQGALGYSFEFDSRVQNGMLHGEKGTKGQPGWLQIDGSVMADGSADLYVSGLVGAAPYAVGRRPAGTAYGYHVRARFVEGAGKGERVEGRPCSVAFRRR
jgi:hypothetical protein